jgi:hypothetical protein
MSSEFIDFCRPIMDRFKRNGVTTVTDAEWARFVELFPKDRDLTYRERRAYTWVSGIKYKQDGVPFKYQFPGTARCCGCCFLPWRTGDFLKRRSPTSSTPSQPPLDASS